MLPQITKPNNPWTWNHSQTFSTDGGMINLYVVVTECYSMLFVALAFIPLKIRCVLLAMKFHFVYLCMVSRVDMTDHIMAAAHWAATLASALATPKWATWQYQRWVQKRSGPNWKGVLFALKFISIKITILQTN